MMNNYSREDILKMVRDEDVGFIRLQFTDIFGTLKNVAVTVSQLEKALDGGYRWLCRCGGFRYVPASGLEHICYISLEAAAR